VIPLLLEREPEHVLLMGAHCDDIEIGCGGTLAFLARCWLRTRFHAVFFSGDVERAAESRNALGRLVGDTARLDIEQHAFRDGFLPMHWSEVKEHFEAVKRRVQPGLVLTHFGADKHQDHRTVSELTWNTFRNHLVLEYEIPKWDGDLARPGAFVPLSRELVDLKTATLIECFPSQAAKRWFTPDLFKGLMRIRGMECNAESGFAEAFHTRKLIFAG
jgi:LmbE family N-acetylglucosaminyl deacetylase